jgi:hypothetical protein
MDNSEQRNFLLNPIVGTGRKFVLEPNQGQINSTAVIEKNQICKEMRKIQQVDY